MNALCNFWFHKKQKKLKTWLYLSFIIAVKMIDIFCFRTHTGDALVSTHTEETHIQDSHWGHTLGTHLWVYKLKRHHSWLTLRTYIEDSHYGRTLWTHIDEVHSGHTLKTLTEDIFEDAHWGIILRTHIKDALLKTNFKAHNNFQVEWFARLLVHVSYSIIQNFGDI